MLLAQFFDCLRENLCRMSGGWAASCLGVHESGNQLLDDSGNVRSQLLIDGLFRGGLDFRFQFAHTQQLTQGRAQRVKVFRQSGTRLGKCAELRRQIGFGTPRHHVWSINPTRALADRSGLLVYIKIEPEFDNLRNDPAYLDLMRRIGLEQ